MKANEDSLYLTIRRTLKDLPPIQSNMHESHDTLSHDKAEDFTKDTVAPPMCMIERAKHGLGLKNGIEENIEGRDPKPSTTLNEE